MRVSRWGEIGILCCIAVAEKGQDEPVGAAEVADHLKIGLQYIQQVMHRLRKGGVIRSTRGPRGGFQLERTPEKTTLKEIMWAAEAGSFEVICDAGPIYDNCGGMRDACGLHVVWRELSDAIEKVLSERTLAQVMELHKGFSPSQSCYVGYYSAERSSASDGSGSDLGEKASVESQS